MFGATYKPESTSRNPAHPRRQRGAVLMVAMVMLLGITLLGLTAMSTSTMELRMASNIQSTVDNFQTVLAAIDFTLDDTANLPSTGPLDVPSPVSLSGAAFAVSGADAVSASAARTKDCGNPPRMRSATSMKSYSSFEFEVSADVDKGDSGAGRSGAVQGYLLLGPKC